MQNYTDLADHDVPVVEGEDKKSRIWTLGEITVQTGEVPGEVFLNMWSGISRSLNTAIRNAHGSNAYIDAAWVADTVSSSFRDRKIKLTSLYQFFCRTNMEGGEKRAYLYVTLSNVPVMSEIPLVVCEIPPRTATERLVETIDTVAIAIHRDGKNIFELTKTHRTSIFSKKEFTEALEAAVLEKAKHIVGLSPIQLDEMGLFHSLRHNETFNTYVEENKKQLDLNYFQHHMGLVDVNVLLGVKPIPNSFGILLEVETEIVSIGNISVGNCTTVVKDYIPVEAIRP